ncbi:MAG: GntR family transcriptional regulator [Verrucomicrobia bacterium]|nr:GntR family transcriptional regulator [Verrucomicrobiota bacterium]
MVSKPNSSTVVSPIDFHNMFNLYSIAWTLESLALRQSFEHITTAKIAVMAEANERLLQALQAGDPYKAVKADNDFHAVYIELSHNDELCQILTGIKQKLKRLELYYFGKAKDIFRSFDEHLSIIDALRKKDLSLALQAVEANWQASFKRIEDK